MDNFLAQPESTRAEAIKEAATRMQLHSSPVEKDFWVCYLLRELFKLECVKNHLIFKGGTSLSKCYGIIERFSEDIDLSIHASAFGVEIEDALAELSKSQRDNRIKTLYRA
ncbi:MAG: nucleotidyl transferase AbiEii/AbiGii toxin family protein, partial [Opitutae bacterium]|nr:nucleotidyl transferase AbiEii/AbiGii toxin family protein [Opitutae bacterium]